MKKRITIYKITFLLILCILATSCLTQKEKETNRSQVNEMIKNNRFKFEAQQANPLRPDIISANLRNLNGNYSLSLSKDTLKCYLPYFGVARSAPYNSTDNGLNFTSTDFSYDKVEKSKGAYEITIIPNDTDKANKLYFTISENGSASLNVTSNNRDPISFTGNILKN
ncbi:MAG: DUF4251 domain-containing protein [Pelobium sp.]